MRKRLLYTALAAIATLAACKSTKYVNEGEYLLTDVDIDNLPRHISHEEAMRYVRQKPNVKILGFWRMNLNIYNLSGHDETKGINNWLRRIGEAPVVYDSTLCTRSAEQLTLFLRSKGYFDAQIRDTAVVRGRKKMKVVYRAEPGQLYRISRMAFTVDDDTMRPTVMADTARTLLHVGDPFDSERHDKERERITRRLQESGYYHFNKDFIYFAADSSYSGKSVNDSMVLIKDRLPERLGKGLVPHLKSKIESVVFILNGHHADTVRADTVSFDKYVLINNGCQTDFDKSLLSKSCFIEPGRLYNVLDVERTQARLNNLKLFRSVGISFEKTDTPVDTAGWNDFLKCTISIRTNTPQSYSVEIEGTNSSGNLGGAGNLRYQHMNLFRNAEVFDIKLRLASQNQFARDGKQRFFTLESGIEMSLTFPKFLSPFNTDDFDKRRNPNTSLSVAYDYQKRPDFTRTVVSSRLSYTWHGSRFVTFTLTPVDVNIVSIPVISDNFHNYISNTYLQYSYSDHFITSANYSFVFNQQKSNVSENSWFARMSIETAGNMMNLIASMLKDANAEGYRNVMGMRFSQYVKADIDLRYLAFINRANSVAYRLFGGVGLPYGNSKALPFEKSYFVGGANSIRAWPVRGLGPGASKGNSLRYHNQTSDVRLEANVEYRCKLFSVFEWAFFADAGNIWALPRTTDADEEKFHFDTFYRQIALGVGGGLRLNFDYFIFRIDAGLKVHDPSRDEGRRWVMKDEKVNWNSVNWNFAIGYPF